MFLRCFIALISKAIQTKRVTKAHVRFLTRLVIGNLASWTHGASVVYPSEIFDPKAIVDAVIAERCTALHGVPTHFLGIFAELDRRQASQEKVDMRTLRYALSC